MACKATYYSLTLAVHVSKEDLPDFLLVGETEFPLYIEGDCVLDHAGFLTLRPEAMEILSEHYQAEAKAIADAKLARLLRRADDGEKT